MVRLVSEVGYAPLPSLSPSAQTLVMFTFTSTSRRRVEKGQMKVEESISRGQRRPVILGYRNPIDHVCAE
jgi:hypothetical protein